MEGEGRSQRAVAADHDDGVDPVRLDRAPHALVAVAVHVRVAAGRAEDGAAALQDAADVVASERAYVAVHEAVPAVEDADDLHVVSHDRAAHDRTGDGVEPGAVAAGGEDP